MVAFVLVFFEGDVLSGTSSSGTHHAGVLEGWFGDHWWNGRLFVLLVTTLCVFAPLACFKRIGELLLLLSGIDTRTLSFHRLVNLIQEMLGCFTVLYVICHYITTYST